MWPIYFALGVLVVVIVIVTSEFQNNPWHDVEW